MLQNNAINKFQENATAEVAQEVNVNVADEVTSDESINAVEGAALNLKKMKNTIYTVAELAEMEKIIGEQGEEIQNAQEKFQNLLSTIENELGTEIPVQVQDEENQSVEPENGEQEEPAKESAQTDFFA